MKKAKQFKVGDKVFAKVKGYPAWPAKITAVNGKKYTVEFYGTGEIGSIKVEDLFYYLKHKSNLVKPSKRKDYNDALEQIEAAVNKDGTDGNEYPEDSLTDVSVSSVVSDKSGPKRKRSVSDKGSDVNEPPQKVGRRKESTDSVSERQEGSTTEDKTDEKTSEVKETKDDVKDTKTEIKGKKSITKQKGDESPSKEETQTDKDESVSKDEPGEKENEATSKKDEKEETKVEKSENQGEKSPEKYNIEDLYGDGVVTGNEEVPPKFCETADTIDSDEERRDQALKRERARRIRKENKVEYNPEIRIVTRKNLRSYIAYAAHVKQHAEIYKAKPEELRNDCMNQVYTVKLPSGKLVALKLHLNWPLAYKDEYSRALYDEQVAKRVLALEKDLKENKVQVEDNPQQFLADFTMDEKQVELKIQSQILKEKQKKADRLKDEAALVELDVKIKSCLGLDKADPYEAVKHLTALCNTDVDKHMLIKHPHVVEMIRRLRKYVGNTEEWHLKGSSLKTFQGGAEQVRAKAEEIWENFKRVIPPHNGKPFWDSFNEIVHNFRTSTRHLKESQILLLHSLPFTREFFMEEYEEQHKDKLDFEKDGLEVVEGEVENKDDKNSKDEEGQDKDKRGDEENKGENENKDDEVKEDEPQAELPPPPQEVTCEQPGEDIGGPSV